jgi:uncharacterized protein (TIGR02453 family)
LSAALPPFNGFNKDIFTFLEELEKNNNTKWFDKNRQRYKDNIVLPAKSFVASIGQFFTQLNPAIRTEPKFNKTIMRINKDMRFSKDAPYKNYFLIHFGRFKMDSEFYLYFDKQGADYGIFLNGEQGDDLHFSHNLARHTKDIIKTFNKYDLNGRYDLHEFKKTPQLVQKNFDAEKHFDLLQKNKYILLEKEIPKKSKSLYTADILTDLVKNYASLYPLYCFAISPRPLKLIDKFEETMGVPV